MFRRSRRGGDCSNRDTISHPCDREKSQGWGNGRTTETRVKSRIRRPVGGRIAVAAEPKKVAVIGCVKSLDLQVAGFEETTICRSAILKKTAKTDPNREDFDTS